MKRSCQFLGFMMVCVVFLCTAVSYAENCEQWVAQVVSVEGQVEAKRVGEPLWQPVQLNATYCEGDMVRVLENSRAEVALVNQPVLRLDQNSTITLGGLKEEKTFFVDLIKGAAHFFSRAPRSISVNTAFVNAGVEGTEFLVKVDEDETFISVFEGRVLATNDAGSLRIGRRQSAAARAGQAPVERVVARPRDAVHWALYYPPVMYAPPGKTVAGDEADPRYLASRASSLLAVGRVDAANTDIGRVLAMDSNNSDALALQSIIAVVQNNKNQGLILAQQAVESDPTSATAHVALSYAQQAGFDLERARASAEEAVKQDSGNALAWARLAELHMSFGELGKALKAAQKAVDLDPNVARTQTVLGYAYITQVKTDKAKAAFEKAIALDSADPLPRLGQGLAKIREGDLAEGRRDIEIAAGLDPNNSLIRSYLGKAYFEEKNDKLDGREFAAAKELDPSDPTPWFYDAIRKQTLNRPVEALQDLQKAIALNDNRAVYRSNLLLDSDLAARSASQARIYSDLGFQQRALVEGWNSVNTDPSNHSAHRFLADSYSVLPRHEIARVSELLQSQLLQPSNMTPIQPGLAESNLFLISSGGAANSSFNEFNPMFNRDRIALQVSGMAGEDETLGGEGVVSGIYGPLSMSAGYSHFETEGWRKNANQEDDIANLFAQYELSHKTSIQGEYRYRNTQSGDLVLRFFDEEGDFSPNEERDEEKSSFRLGLRHAFSPSSIVLANLTKSDFDGTLSDEPVDPVLNSIDIETDEEAIGSELQYLFRSNYIHVVSGVGYFNVDSEDKTVTDLNLPPPPFGPGPMTLEETYDNDVNHTNLYLYSYIHPLKSVTLTVGASGDIFDTNDETIDDKDQFNPKFGINWKPLPDTTFRAAAFRVLKRTLITDQTLEPTQVAGFNQFFDDSTGTDAWRYGGAVDQKFSANIYGGVELSYRDLDVQFLNPISGDTDTVDWEEYLGRAYIFWAPHKWITFSAEYQYEKFERDEVFTAGIKELETHRVPLGINFFHPSGLSVSTKATYFYQEGKFEQTPPPPGIFVSDDDDFWVVDAAIKYRLPKRYGFITVGVSNLFDEDFKYEDTDVNNPEIQPSRVVFAKVTLALP